MSSLLHPGCVDPQPSRGALAESGADYEGGGRVHFILVTVWKMDVKEARPEAEKRLESLTMRAKHR